MKDPEVTNPPGNVVRVATELIFSASAPIPRICPAELSFHSAMDDWLVGIVSPIGFSAASHVHAATLFSDRVKQAPWYSSSQSCSSGVLFPLDLSWSSGNLRCHAAAIDSEAAIPFESFYRGRDGFQ